jgi:hypothetical protein
MKFIRISVLLVLFVLLNYWGVLSFKYAKSYEENTVAIAKECDIHGLAQEKWENIASTISFGLYKNKTKEKLDKLRKKQALNKKLSREYLYYFLATLTLILIIALFCIPALNILIFAFSALISLIFGLINPILMVTIHKKIDYLGDIILSFESKGILGSIYKLFDSGEYVVGGAILLFSVLIPLLKILVLIFAVLFEKFEFPHKLVDFFKHLGKWSMLDVFVVAIFLVYLTSNSADVTHAEIQIGLYYFLIYVILSMITTIKLLNRKS